MDFQFVNKTSKSRNLSRSDRDEKFLIQSHVQTRRRKRQKQQRRAADEIVSHSSSDEEKASKRSTTFSATVSPRSTPETTGSILNSPNDHSIFVSSHNSPSFPLFQPTYNSFDPFHCTSVGIDATTHVMLKQVFSSAAAPMFLAEAFAPIRAINSTLSFRHDRIILARLQRCVDDDMLMYCTLAHGSSYQAWATGVIDVDTPPEFFLGKAIERVRRHLAASDVPGADNWLLLSIYALTITELWNGVPEMWANNPALYMRKKLTAEEGLKGAETHLRVMRSLIEGNGGMLAVDPYVMELLILADKFLAMYRLSQPILPLTWDPGHLSIEDLRLSIMSPVDEGPPSTAGWGFASASISDNLRTIILDINDYANLARRAWQNSHSLPADAERYLFLRLQALTHRLLSIDAAAYTDLENCVRLTCMLTLLLSTQAQASTLIAAITLSHLQTALLQLQSSRAHVTRGLVFWCVATAAMTEIPTPEREWFLEKTRFVGDAIGVEGDVDSFERYLGAYLYLEEQRGKLTTMLGRLQRKKSWNGKTIASMGVNETLNGADVIGALF